MNFISDHRLVALWLVFVFAVLSPVAGEQVRASSAIDAPLGEVVEIGQFGDKLVGDNSIGFEWVNPRRVDEVRVEGIDASLADSLGLQWWGSVWPASGQGGWMRLDDQWNGKWVPVDTKAQKNDAGQWVFKFPPLTKKEFDKDPKPPMPKPPTWRKTLKVRVVADGKEIPKQARVLVYGDSRWKESSFDIEVQATQDGISSGQIEIINGKLLSMQSLPGPRSTEIKGSSWTAQSVAGGSAGVRITLRWADNKDLTSEDITRVTVRLGTESGSNGFTFVPQEVVREKAIRLRDFGALVAESTSGLTPANFPGPSGEVWSKPVRLRINERPEATRASAMAGIPRLRPLRHAPLGVPSARQEIFVSPGGDWSIWALSLNADNGQDNQRWPFQKKFRSRVFDRLYARIDTREQPRFDYGDRDGQLRYLEEGHLPLIHVKWRNGPIQFHHALSTTILLGDYGDDVNRRGDETVVLLTKLAITNTADESQPAILNLQYTNNTPITLQHDGIIALKPSDPNAVPADLTALRGMISNDQPAGGSVQGWKVVPGNKPDSPKILRWQATLKPHETRTIYFKAPFVEQLDARELARLKEISYEKEIPKVLDYWRERFTKGMVIDVPDPAINNLYKANLWHNVITTDRDPETGLYNMGVGTVQYRVFGNETVMIGRSLDMRGEHSEAERIFEPFLHYQGEEQLKGRFSTKEGTFHSAGRYTHGEYAMNHGFVMWGVGDHYMITRNRAYLERVAPKLIKGCDFMISQRKSTMTPLGAPRLPYHGFSPASSLEDVVEYKYWLSVNGYFYLGMKRVAQALTDIGHPEAKRLTEEAEKYRQDIEIAARQAATRSAVVRLLDGNYIPYVPSRVYQWRHCTEGWIREGLYPALHLGTAEVVTPEDPLITWMLDDLEDNIFFSVASGYGVRHYNEVWFELGGLTPQPCLLDTPLMYMARNEIKAAMRSFWNVYALSIYPDIACFAERWTGIQNL